MTREKRRASEASRTRERYGSALEALAAYGRPHTRLLGVGMLGALGVVACRLAIPWPLRWALETAQGISSTHGWTGGFGDPLPVITLGYLLIAIVLGGSEHLQRLHLGRFTAQLVHDLRAAAVRGVAAIGNHEAVQMGDVTARVIGDSARLRSDLSGIAVHASTNGMLFLAVTAIMFAVSTFFGAIFLVSGVLALCIGSATARMVEPSARRQREREGEYAETLQARLAEQEGAPRLTDSSGPRELRTTRLMTRASWLVHGVLGASVALGLWFGVREVRAGAMVQGELFLFVAYALTVHRRMVQVGRQVARTGKVVASTNRLGSLAFKAALQSAPAPTVLAEAFRVVDGEISSDRRRARLAQIDLAIAPRSRVAVIGPTGAGKTSLLRLLAGREAGFRGRVFWDDHPMDPETGVLWPRVAYLGEKTVFGRRPLWELVGLRNGNGPDPDQLETLRRIGAWQVARRISKRLTTQVSSAQLSSGEARALSLAHLLLADDSAMWILDGALEGLSKRKAQRRLAEIFDRAGDRPVVISMGRAVALERFDRVVALRRGRIVFDGMPTDWQQRERTVSESSMREDEPCVH